MVSSAAIMQPYFLPYLGYWQLIHACNDFVLYDDVNFIKRGWINRNTFLINGQANKLTLPCRAVSQNKLINEIRLQRDSRDFHKVFLAIESAYTRSPNYGAVLELLNAIKAFPGDNLADFLHHAITLVCSFIGLDRPIHRSSCEFSETKGLGRVERLAEITRLLGHTQYINAPGGADLYSVDEFGHYGVSLRFLAPHLRPYRQPVTDFVPGLSIVDVLMNCSPEETLNLIAMYTLD